MRVVRNVPLGVPVPSLGFVTGPHLYDHPDGSRRDRVEVCQALFDLLAREEPVAAAVQLLEEPVARRALLCGVHEREELLRVHLRTQ